MGSMVAETAMGQNCREIGSAAAGVVHRLEQVLVRDHVEGEGLVAGRLEEHDDPVALLVRLHAAEPPPWVPHPLAEREGPVVGLHALAAVAVVAVAAALPVLLAEQLEHDAAP